MATVTAIWNSSDSSQLLPLIHSSKPPTLLPVLQQSTSKTFLTADYTWSLNTESYRLQDVGSIFNDLLWHPVRFLVGVAFSAFDIILAAPPLLRCGLLYLFVRYIVHSYLLWAISDYQAYLDLGRGGTPSNMWGWWRVTRLKLMAGVNVFEPPHVPPMMTPYRGILWSLPQREGPRPIVKGVAPQRQFDQRTPVSTFDALLTMLMTFVEANPHDLKMDTSFLEGHTPALKLNSSDNTGIPNTQGEFGFEVCHPHLNDGSLHMIMHPEDIRTAIEAGWAERHPLATGSLHWRLWYHGIRQKRTPASEYLVLIYAPRNQAEFEVVYTLIQASIWYASSKVLDGKVPELDNFIAANLLERRNSMASSCSECSC